MGVVRANWNVENERHAHNEMTLHQRCPDKMSGS